MGNVGKIIRSSHCNGYVDREYDMNGAEIIAEGDGWIVCKKTDGRNVFIDFQTFDWDRDEHGNFTGGISNLSTSSEMQGLINSWV